MCLLVDPPPMQKNCSACGKEIDLHLAHMLLPGGRDLCYSCMRKHMSEENEFCAPC